MFNRGCCKNHFNKFFNPKHLEEHNIILNYKIINEIIINKDNKKIKELYTNLKNILL